MVNAQVYDKYIHFASIYTTNHISPFLPIKHLVNQNGELTTPHKLATVTKTSVSNPCVLFCPFVVRKATAHVDTKALNMRHQSQKCRCVIFVGIPEHQKGNLIYAPSTRKINSSHDIVFYKMFSSALAYKSRPYSDSLDMRTAV